MLSYEISKYGDDCYGVYVNDQVSLDQARLNQPDIARFNTKEDAEEYADFLFAKRQEWQWINKGAFWHCPKCDQRYMKKMVLKHNFYHCPYCGQLLSI